MTKLNQVLEGDSPVSILAQLTNRFLFIRRDEFHDESSEVNRHHGYIEFLTGLLVTRQFPSGDPKELTSHREEIWQRLKDYYLAVQRDLMAARLEKEDPLHSLAFDAKNYSLGVRGEAYPHQLEQMATGLYREHDEWFKNTLGFTIRDALHAFHAVMALSAWRHQVRSSTEDPVGQAEALDKYAEEILGFTVSDLERASELPRATCESARGPARDDRFELPRPPPWPTFAPCVTTSRVCRARTRARQVGRTRTKRYKEECDRRAFWCLRW